jgi:hypothetical protein
MGAAATETSRYCPMCATPMRPRAVFCHRCGRPVPDETAVVFKQKKSKKKRIAAQKPSQSKVVKETETPPEVVSGNMTDLSRNGDSKFAVEEIAPETTPGIEKPNTAQPPPPPMPKPRRIVKTTEYVWEESGSDPTLRFISFAVIALAFVILVFWLAGFIRF